MRLLTTKKVRKIIESCLSKHNVTVVSSKTRRDRTSYFSIPHEVRDAAKDYGSAVRKIDYNVSWEERASIDSALKEIRTMLALSGSPQQGRTPYIYSWHGNKTTISFYAYME